MLSNLYFQHLNVQLIFLIFLSIIFIYGLFYIFSEQGIIQKLQSKNLDKKLERINIYLDIVKNILTILAIIGATAWFLYQDQGAIKAKVFINNVESINLDKNHKLVRVEIIFNNLGKRKLDITQGVVYLEQIKPIHKNAVKSFRLHNINQKINEYNPKFIYEASLAVRGYPEILWPSIGNTYGKVENKDKINEIKLWSTTDIGFMTLQSNEEDNLYYDFIIPNNTEVVIAYCQFETNKKFKGNLVRWYDSKLVRLSDI